MTDVPLLDVRDLSVDFSVRTGRYGERRGRLRAVHEASFHVAPGEVLALVGESGSGKSTTGYTILGRYRPSSGRIRFDGKDVTNLDRAGLRRLRREIQMVFQDPQGSLNPRLRVEEIVGEPLVAHGYAPDRDELRRRVRELLTLCGLSPDMASRYPNAFSGGQQQRIGIARAIALDPRLLIADEPVSALDVSVQAQIIGLLQHLQRELGLSILFITHNLALVRHIAQRVAVMYAGRIVETAPTGALFTDPQHPYTTALLSAIPIPDPELEGRRRRIILRGDPPDQLGGDVGCVFRSRCPIAVARCETEHPPLATTAAGHDVACWEAGADDATPMRERVRANLGGGPT